jgi:hypothetical protein
MMKFESDLDAGVVEFVVDGGVTRAEYDEGVAAMEAAIAHHGKVSALAVIHSFAGMELAAWWKDVSWGATHLGKIERAAVVTNIAWIETATKMGRMMVPAEVQLFSMEELDAAKAWVRGH